jgi:hypothetical protein
MRQFIMGHRIGVKRHRDDDVFDGSFHVGLRHEVSPFFLPAATNSVGSGQRCREFMNCV